MTRREVAERLAKLYEHRAMQGYVRWKVRTDPAYGAVLDALKGRKRALLDLGCGVGLLAFYLREHGQTMPILGVDFDKRKIDAARIAAQRYRGIDFITGDARDPLPAKHDVVILDILQYFHADELESLLTNVAKAAGPDGVVVIRQGIGDRSWRARITRFVDTLGRIVRWMKSDRLIFPTREQIIAPFADFDVEVRPLWGRTPYNNYLFVFTPRATARRPE